MKGDIIKASQIYKIIHGPYSLFYFIQNFSMKLEIIN